MDPTPVNHGRNRNRTSTRRSNDKAIRDYIVVTESFARDLEKKVMTKIEAGFVPLGGIAILGSGQNVKFLQAMVKY